MSDFVTECAVLIGVILIAMILGKFAHRSLGATVFQRVTRAPDGSPTEEVDPLVEAEVYFAYGRKEQAIAVLEEAIKLQPSRHQEFENRIRELKAMPKPFSPITKL